MLLHHTSTTFLIFQILTPPLPPRGSQLKFTPSPLKRQGRGGSELWLGSLRVVFQKLLKGAQFQAIIVVLSSISTK